MNVKINFDILGANEPMQDAARMMERAKLVVGHHVMALIEDAEPGDGTLYDQGGQVVGTVEVTK